MNRKFKIAIVVQQCGTEVLAGAERYALNFALALAKLGCEVTVLTTQSADYNTWENALRAVEKVRSDTSQIQGSEQPAEIEILRFPNHSFRKPILLRISKLLWLLEKIITPKSRNWLSTILDNFFLWAQGPWCPRLWNYLGQNSENFDLIIFKSYLYAPCVFGLSFSAKSTKKIFISTAHPEPAFYRPFVEKMLENSSVLGFVSKAERDLVKNTWRISREKDQLLLPPGLGNEWTSEMQETDRKTVRPSVTKLRNYFLVLGRMDKGKNLELILSNIEPGMTVVFAGPGQMEIPDEKHFIILGKVSEEEKAILLENALALIAVSKNEAFSMTTAEALSRGCPVIGWSQSAAVSELIDNYGGAKFSSIDEYKELLRKFSSNSDFRRSALPDKEKIRLELSWKKSAEKVVHWLEQQT